MYQEVITIENCRFKFKCPKTWDQLSPSGNPSIRNCNQYQRQVHHCQTDKELQQAASKGHCVAIIHLGSSNMGEALMP